MKTAQKTVKLSDIIFDKNIYPRQEHDPHLVQRYAEDMDSIEAQCKFMSVAADMRLIDGRHRHLAYLTLYLDEPDHEIQVFVYPVTADKDIYGLAAELNSDAGWQMTPDDKKLAAIKMFENFGYTQDEIAKALKARKAKVNQWLKEILEAKREEREAKIWSMWLSCHDKKEIAEMLEISPQTVSRFLQETSIQFHGNDLEVFRNFKPQIYSVWDFPKLTNSTKVFGSIPQEIIDNLLYYYTEPFNVVFDPFTGGGSTIDKCVERKRRYYASDLTPIVARQDEIRQWDITDGLPPDLPIPDFVFLDPPYWKQAEEKYSAKETDLGNVELDTFLNTIGNIARDIKRKWGQSRPDAKLALIIGPYRENGQDVDLAFLCYERISKYLKLEKRIQVPYPTQIHGGAYVKQAKENKDILYLSRDLMIFGGNG